MGSERKAKSIIKIKIDREKVNIWEIEKLNPLQAECFRILRERNVRSQ